MDHVAVGLGDATLQALIFLDPQSMKPLMNFSCPNLTALKLDSPFFGIIVPCRSQSVSILHIPTHHLPPVSTSKIA